MNDENPYRAPSVLSVGAVEPQSRNSLGIVGCTLAIMGIVPILVIPLLALALPCKKPFDGLWYCYVVLTSLVLLSPIAVAISSVGMIWRPRRAAFWGIALGILGSLFGPSFVFSAVSSTRQLLDRELKKEPVVLTR